MCDRACDRGSPAAWSSPCPDSHHPASSNPMLGARGGRGRRRSSGELCSCPGSNRLQTGKGLGTVLWGSGHPRLQEGTTPPPARRERTSFLMDRQLQSVPGRGLCPCPRVVPAPGSPGSLLRPGRPVGQGATLP